MKNSMNYLPLRAHHLLCTVLYQGKGYSEEFTNNMTSIVNLLLEEDMPVVLKKSPDLICSTCPNLLEDGGCNLDHIDNLDNTSEQTSPQIKDLDSFICEYFNFELDTPINRVQLFKTIENNITKDFFESCCQNCRWYKQGLCNYEAYRNNLSKFSNMFS